MLFFCTIDEPPNGRGRLPQIGTDIVHGSGDYDAGISCKFADLCRRVLPHHQQTDTGSPRPQPRHDLVQQVQDHRDIGVITHLTREHQSIGITLDVGVEPEVLLVHTIGEDRDRGWSHIRWQNIQQGRFIGR